MLSRKPINKKSKPKTSASDKRSKLPNHRSYLIAVRPNKKVHASMPALRNIRISYSRSETFPLFRIFAEYANTDGQHYSSLLSSDEVTSRVTVIKTQCLY
ncbi:unnamed protein product [Spodoptera littoralis]|uniref:Uncharacterized protein n=1 Tax=Spodoptera littoralis TaxID=7109 RepID=A0A9P0NBH7_SPOLI|nr:unnamed protein product [Spodoptera littoralis]CAH1646827.1 unnamed protein product [Spodoptera littoralis]